jgi:hypothetical protein
LKSWENRPHGGIGMKDEGEGKHALMVFLILWKLSILYYTSNLFSLVVRFVLSRKSETSEIRRPKCQSSQRYSHTASRDRDGVRTLAIQVLIVSFELLVSPRTKGESSRYSD